MALIVEDGSIVTDANTYLTIAEADTILDAKFGIVPLPALTEQNIKLAAQYLEGFEDDYVGEQVQPTVQELAWPRQNAYINDCNLFPSDEIPSELKIAQALAAYEESQGNSLQPTTSNQNITSKNIAGAISLTYSDNGLESGVKQFRKVNQYLSGLLRKQKASTVVGRA